MAYLNSGRSQSIRRKKIIKNCDTANNVKSRKNVYLMCMFIVKNDVKSVKNEKRLKIKRENNNSGLLLCWHLLCDYLVIWLRWNSLVWFSQQRLSVTMGKLHGRTFFSLEFAIDNNFVSMEKWISGEISNCIKNLEKCEIRGYRDHQDYLNIWAAHCVQIHPVGGGWTAIIICCNDWTIPLI